MIAWICACCSSADSAVLPRIAAIFLSFSRYMAVSSALIFFCPSESSSDSSLSAPDESRCGFRFDASTSSMLMSLLYSLSLSLTAVLKARSPASYAASQPAIELTHLLVLRGGVSLDVRVRRGQLLLHALDVRLELPHVLRELRGHLLARVPGLLRERPHLVRRLAQVLAELHRHGLLHLSESLLPALGLVQEQHVCLLLDVLEHVAHLLHPVERVAEDLVLVVAHLRDRRVLRRAGVLRRGVLL